MANLTETWAPVLGYEGLYEVSDMGRIRSVDYFQSATNPRTGKTCVFFRKSAIRRTQVRFDGYVSVRLNRGKPKTLLVHRVVLEAFLGVKPEGCQTCHSDGNKTNNRLSNLCWGTVNQNASDRVRHGTQARGELHGNAKLNREAIHQIRNLAGSGSTQAEIGSSLNINQATVSKILRGERWSHV